VANTFMYRLYPPKNPSAIQKNIKRQAPRFLPSARRALPALFLPVIILGGIYGGLFTPIEAAAVSVVCAFVVGFWIYRNLSLLPNRTSRAPLRKQFLFRLFH
jgi:C4-dicarboxylate transporter DctM subunit